MVRMEFELTEDEYRALLDASKPVPYLLGTGGLAPSSPQENANYAWAALGKKRGFQHMTVQAGRDKYHFTAESTAPAPAERGE